ncbi:MAG: T9SS type A sorting domain-containing protein [Bacteroidota bacterium]
MKKALLVTFIFISQLFLLGGEGNTCLAQGRNFGVEQGGIVDKITVFPQQSRVLVQWTLTEPAENVNFILERKNAQGAFELVAATRNTPQLRYTLTDFDPVTEGSVVYRVRYTRIGSYQNLGHSDLFTLHWDNESILTIYPNPASEVAYFRLPVSQQEGTYAIRVSSAEGNIMHKTRAGTSSFTAHRLDVRRYRPGTYYLHVATRNQHWVSRFVKI